LGIADFLQDCGISGLNNCSLVRRGLTAQQMGVRGADYPEHAYA
jgi:hypothetical protein